MGSIVAQAMGLLVASLVEGNIHVKDSTAWTVSEIARLHARAIPVQQLMPLLQNDDGARRRAARGVQGLRVIHHLAERRRRSGAGSSGSPRRSWGMMKELSKVVEREDGDECNPRQPRDPNMLVEKHS